MSDWRRTGESTVRPPGRRAVRFEHYRCGSCRRMAVLPEGMTVHALGACCCEQVRA